jgi:putative hydrolases of HD superfamily
MGTIPPPGSQKYAPQADPRAVTDDQVAGMPEVLASAVRELVAEYEAKESQEAVCARDADKLECMVQGVEYKAQGSVAAARMVRMSRSPSPLSTRDARQSCPVVHGC